MKLSGARLLALIAALAASGPGGLCARHTTRSTNLPWYVTAGAIHRVTLKPSTRYWRFEHLSLDPVLAKQQMLAWKQEGITALEIFAPEAGGNSYDGLDTKDRFALDSGLGSIRDFKRVVKLAHSLGLRVITFQNLGYSSPQSAAFHAEEDAVRQGAAEQNNMFFWSKRSDAPQPAASNSFFFCRPSLPDYQPEKNEFWQWSARAQAYYWTRWPGKDQDGNLIRLPQHDWSGTAWPRQAAAVVHFWMNTGLDGMVLDAVNWYVGATWSKINQYITAVIAGYGADLSQPEGGGGFGDDPVGWVTEGKFTNIYDYGLGIWWQKNSRPLVESVEQHSPDLLERALRSYHDRVVAAGGTLYFPVPKLQEERAQAFAEALIATSGDLPCYCDPVGGVTRPAKGIPELLMLKAEHPALFQNSLRRRIATDDDANIYAVERYASDDKERLLLVFNFADHPVLAKVDLAAVNGQRYTDLQSHTPPETSQGKLTFRLEPSAYRIFSISGYPRSATTTPSR